jgi:hypothetical protein
MQLRTSINKQQLLPFSSFQTLASLFFLPFLLSFLSSFFYLALLCSGVMLETDTAITPDLIPSTTPDSMQTGSPPTRQPKFMAKVSQLFNRRAAQTDEKLTSFDDQGIQTTTITAEQQQQQYHRRRTKSGSSNADSAISKIDSMFSMESRVSSEHPDAAAFAIENNLGSRTVHIGSVNTAAVSGSQQSDRDLNEAFEKLMVSQATQTRHTRRKAFFELLFIDSTEL